MKAACGFSLLSLKFPHSTIDLLRGKYVGAAKSRRWPEYTSSTVCVHCTTTCKQWIGLTAENMCIETHYLHTLVFVHLQYVHNLYVDMYFLWSWSKSTEEKDSREKENVVISVQLLKLDILDTLIHVLISCKPIITEAVNFSYSVPSYVYGLLLITIPCLSVQSPSRSVSSYMYFLRLANFASWRAIANFLLQLLRQLFATAVLTNRWLLCLNCSLPAETSTQVLG